MGRIWPISTLRRTPRTERKEQPALDPDYLVKFDQDDPANPQDWPVLYKCWITFQLGMLALVGSLASSITTPADDTIAKYIGVNSEAAVLDVSLYLWVMSRALVILYIVD